MKYEKFVSEEGVEISQNEIDYFVNHLKEKVKEYDLPFSFSEVENDISPTTYHIIFNCDKEICGRNINKERIMFVYRFFVTLRKSSGYLDDTNWYVDKERKKNYIDAPPFQYETTFGFDCYYKPYRSKSARCFANVKDNYQYGTEFSDFNFDNCFSSIKEKITMISK
jgi:hypothetical protein